MEKMSRELAVIDFFSFEDGNQGSSIFLGTIVTEVEHGIQQVSIYNGCFSEELIKKDVTTVIIRGRRFVLKKESSKYSEKFDEYVDMYSAYIPRELFSLNTCTCCSGKKSKEK